jgi:streptogramin lyase/pimeloyl-ACP methyl ester carboxylesterase
VSLDSRLGTVLAGYRIEAILGRGGMGVVYLAEQAALGRKVALKILSSDLAADETFRRRFIRESQLAASIEHPNIIPIYDAAEAEGELFIAMRFIDGPNLATVIHDEGPLAFDRTISIMSQVGDALDAAHQQGLVHRDVKPANILIAPGQHGELVFLSDFGVTKRGTSESHLTSSGQLLGTVDYMAPEQIQGKAVDGRADLYSLGCVVFESLTRHKPFERDGDVAVLWAHMMSDPPAVSEHRTVPEAVDRAVARALAKAPEDRFGTSRELVDALKQNLVGEAAPKPVRRPRQRRRPAARSARRMIPTVRWARSWPARALAATLAVAVGVGVYIAVRPSAHPVDLAGMANVLASLDPAGGSVKSAIQVGDAPSAVAVDPDGRVWVVNRGAGTLERFDPKTGQTAQVGTTTNPTGMAIGGGSVWVLGGFPTSTVTPFDLTKGTRGEVIDLQTDAEDIAFGNGSIWVTDTRHKALIRIDQGSRQPTPADVPGIPTGVAVGGGFVWVTVDGGDEQDLVRLDPGSGVTRKFPLPGRANSVAVGETGEVWVTEGDEGAVLRIEGDTGRVVRSFRVGTDPVRVDVGDGAVWVANFEGRSVSRVDPLAGTVQTVPLGLAPTAVEAREGRVWVTANQDTHPLQKALCAEDIPLSDPVECFTLRVPERHTDPGGRAITLWVERIRTGLGSSPAPDPVVVAGENLAEHVDYANVQPLPSRTNRETIVLETRGAGRSTPKLVCRELERSAPGSLTLRLSQPATRSAFLDAVGTCHDRLAGEGIDLGAYNVTEAAEDVEDLRRAVGVSKVNLRALGYSSRVAFEMMRLFPASVRAVWMDSPEYPQDDYFGQAAQRSREAISALISACEADAACQQRFPKLQEMFNSTVAALDARPEMVTVHDSTVANSRSVHVLIDGDLFARVVRQDVSVGAGQPLMPARIYAASNRAFSTSAEGLAADLVDRFELCVGYRPHCASPADVSEGLGLSMLCHDEAPFTDRGALDSLPQGFAEDYGKNPYLDACSVWDVGKASSLSHRASESPIPILILHGEFDGYSPPSTAREGARRLRRSFVYTVPGLGYNVLGDGCTIGIRNAWINDPAVEPDVSCLAEMPAVVGGSFNLGLREY